VSLPDMIRGPAKYALLARATIYAQPSRHENFGISVAEALHAGAPCVVSTGVALGADIAECEAGLVVPRETDRFEFALRTLMSDAALRRRQSENARRLAARFSPAAVATELDREYRVCLEGRPRGSSPRPTTASVTSY
jgi:glycosyltransferase involved in cell wall biosynthesis